MNQREKGSWLRSIGCIFACASVTLVLPRTSAVRAAEGLEGAIAITSQEAVAHVPVVEVTSPVPWAQGTMRVDGDLGDWKSSAAAPVVLAGEKHASWFKGSYRGREDLAASAWLCRDDRFLYLAMAIADDALPVPERIEVALTPADSPLITTWRDVGMRYGGDDVHLVFLMGRDDSIRMVWAHVQKRMDAGVLSNSFGTEEQRREFVEQRADAATTPKVFAKHSRRLQDSKSITVFEAALPWKLLAPYVPVGYAPLKFNAAVFDKDDGHGPASGAVAWTPGLVGTYSAAHFATLTFAPRVGSKTPEAFAQLPQTHYVNQNVEATLSFHNPGAAAQTGRVELFVSPHGPGNALLTAPVTLPPGYSRTNLAIHSEKIGLTRCGFRGRVTLDGGTVMDVPVHAPSMDDTITITPVAEIQAKIDQLERNTAVLSRLYDQLAAKGLDTAYPRAYLTLHRMFIPRCQGDLKSGDSARVLRNTAHLEKLFESAKAYMEQVLTAPSAELKLPPRLAPDRLVVKDGYYHAGGKPVFLWGPCTFWYLRNDQHYAWELGFNSVGPEVPIHDDKALPDIKAYLDAFSKNNMLVNASIGSANFDALKKEHPDVANLDGNNFMPFLVQHPIARQEIVKRFRKDIGFLRRFPGVRSYWLWNEPAYSNFSENTRRDYIEQHLKPRYKTVEALNARWRSAYKSFDDITLVKTPDPGNDAPWYDFQRFRDELLMDFFAFLHKTAKGVDDTRPTHVKFMARSLAQLDIERLQGLYEIAGHDGNPADIDIIFLDFCKSLYPDHPLVNTEIHIWYRDKVFVELVAWRLALHGLADGNWWCWHSNPRFSNTVGSAESMHGLTVSGLDLQRLFDPYMVALNKKARPVATLFPDVVPGRSERSVDRLRFELGPAQYSLGVHPFYVTEARAAQGELSKHKLLLAGESDYVKESTYRAVVDYVKRGGKTIVVRGGFAHNEYGDPRDASDLVQPNGGVPFGEGARVYPLGKGQVVCVDSIANLPPVEPKEATKQADGESPPLSRQTIYRRVLARAMTAFGLEDPLRLAAADAADTTPDSLAGLDWRSAEVDGAYVLCVLPADYWNGKTAWTARLATGRPVKRIVNLITAAEMAPGAFKIEGGPNLLRIELEK